MRVLVGAGGAILCAALGFFLWQVLRGPEAGFWVQWTFADGATRSSEPEFIAVYCRAHEGVVPTQATADAAFATYNAIFDAGPGPEPSSLRDLEGAEFAAGLREFERSFEARVARARTGMREAFNCRIGDQIYSRDERPALPAV